MRKSFTCGDLLRFLFFVAVDYDDGHDSASERGDGVPASVFGRWPYVDVHFS